MIITSETTVGEGFLELPVKLLSGKPEDLKITISKTNKQKQNKTLLIPSGER